MNKRAQGLPLNMIVIAIVALLVLVIVFAYFTGAFGNILKQTSTLQGTVQADVTSAQTKCSQYCISAQNANYNNFNDWKTSSDFCQQTFPIEGEDSEKHCYESPISHSCTIKIDGTEYTGCNDIQI